MYVCMYGCMYVCIHVYMYIRKCIVVMFYKRNISETPAKITRGKDPNLLWKRQFPPPPNASGSLSLRAANELGC